MSGFASGAAGGALQFQIRQDSASNTFSVERVTIRTKDAGARRV